MDGQISTKHKILSIDGGGVRGLYTAILIAEIENKLNIKFSDYFNVFVGVSTGSIISTLLWLGYSGLEIYNIYSKNYKDIFKKNNSGSIVKYDINNLNNVISKIIKKDKMDRVDFNKKLYISAYNISGKKEEVFSIDKNNTYKDISNYITASCAAPYYFDAFKIKNDKYVDGGIINNNPALLGYSKIISKISNDLSKIKILSLGTIENKSNMNLEFKDIYTMITKDYMNLISLFMEASIKSTDSILKDIFIEYPNNYLRINDSSYDIKIDEITKDVYMKIKHIENTYLNYKTEIINFFGD